MPVTGMVRRVKFDIVPAHELTLAAQAKVFTDAFTGYVGGSIELDATRLAAFIAVQGIDLCYSRFARDDMGQFISFGYINRTGNVSRLAGMGTVEAARRSGAAAFVLTRLVEEAQKRGDMAMILEVIEQNPAAVALYRSNDFRSLGRLFGWRSSEDRTAGGSSGLREIPVLEAMKFPAALDYPDLPWQVSRHAVAKAVSTRAFAYEDVAVVTGDPTAALVRIYSFLGVDGRKWDSLRTLSAALLAKFPDRQFFASPVFPEEFEAEIFQPLNFRKESLTQFLMRRDLVKQ